jgi:hypothetical protein
MTTRILCTALLLSLALAPSQAFASQLWTFCVAAAPGGKEAWITDVFAAVRDRERLEADLKAFLRAQGVAGAIAQCPLPKDDKTEVVNAQFTAAEFNRKLGHTLHELPARDFAPRQ